jgi:hypothetical protein
MLIGCTNTLEFTIPSSETLQVVKWNSGSIVTKCQIQPNSVEQENLLNWLAKNKDEWKETPASYAPNLLVFGKSFSLNFMGTTVIFNHNGQQYYHPIEQNQYQFLMCSQQ